MQPHDPRAVVVGGGFAALEIALALKRLPVRGGLNAAIDAMLDKEVRIVGRRLREHRPAHARPENPDDAGPGVRALR